MFNKLRSKKGFTLIELLIVVAIIGILAAIAIPQFSSYQKRGYASAVRSDVKNADVAVKAWFSDNPGVACPAQAAITGPASLPAYPSARVSKSVTITVATGLEDTYTVNGSHAGLPSKNYMIAGSGSVLTDDLSTGWN